MVYSVYGRGGFVVTRLLVLTGGSGLELGVLASVGTVLDEAMLEDMTRDG